jgi:hypothetical protein
MKIYRSKNAVESQEAIYEEGQEFEHYFAMGVVGPFYWYLALKRNNFGDKSIWEIAQMRIWQDVGTFGLGVDMESVKQLIKLLKEENSSKSGVTNEGYI